MNYSVARKLTTVEPGKYVLALGVDLACVEGFDEYCEASGYTIVSEPNEAMSRINGVSEKDDPVVQAVLAILKAGFDALCEQAKGHCHG